MSSLNIQVKSHAMGFMMPKISQILLAMTNIRYHMQPNTEQPLSAGEICCFGHCIYNEQQPYPFPR
jgi:hypothetical protein